MGGAAAPAPAAAPERPAFRADFGHYAIQEGDKVIPMSPLRKLVAEHMVYSKLTSPHVGTVAEIDLGGVSRLRSAHKDRFAETQGVPLTFLPFVVHATVCALREHPALNASVVGDAIAVETPRGAVAFLGASGCGKSTLGASFVREAFPLLADDGLLLTEHRGTLAGVPSYPEIRLWPDAYAALSSASGARRARRLVRKRRLCAGSGRWPFGIGPVPISRLYVLGPRAAAEGDHGVAIQPLTRREAFVELVRHSFRLDFHDAPRLLGEFDRIAAIASGCAVYRLTFAREWSRLAAVRHAVLEHLAAA